VGVSRTNELESDRGVEEPCRLNAREGVEETEAGSSLICIRFVFGVFRGVLTALADIGAVALLGACALGLLGVLGGVARPVDADVNKDDAYSASRCSLTNVCMSPLTQ
jgi:hypothetical protein